MTDLSTRYLGLALRSPLIASSSPLTGDVETIRELEAAGASAVVLPSLFEEQIELDTNELDREFALRQDSFGQPSGRPPTVDDYNRGLGGYLELIEAAKEAVEIPVVASMNGSNLGAWIRYARLVQDAGADALELNLYNVAADPVPSCLTLESEQTGLIGLLADQLTIPVAVKISPFYTSVASFVLSAQEAGAAGVVMFNRFYVPDVQLDTLGVSPTLALSHPSDLGLPLRWIGIVRDSLAISIAGASGVYTGGDVAKLVLAGADAVTIASSLLRYGPEHLATIEDQLRDWMRQQGHESLTDIRGLVSRTSAMDPTPYERANYIGTLAGAASRWRQTHDA